jgi:hypothetical protein
MIVVPITAPTWVALYVKLQRVLAAPFEIERAEDQPAFNQVGLSGSGHSGRVCWLSGQPLA